MPKSMIKITFPDGSTKEYEKGKTGKEIAESISQGLAQEAVGILVNREPKDLNYKIEDSCEIKILKFEDEEGKYIFRHSSAHLMAHAVLKLFPEAKLTIGPVVEEGFYYDIDHPPFKEEDLARIEAEMKIIAKQNLPITRKEIPVKEALKMFKDNKYKVEILKNIEEFGEGKTDKSDIVSVYEQGEFFDLCRGPHLPSTGMIKAFKLTKIAGAYWRGDAKNKQLQRIYGISFPDKKLLQEYLDLIVEAEKRDHRKIGRNLELYTFHEYSPGSPFFHPKGAVIYNELLKLMREEYRKRGYDEVITPLVYDKTLWEISGHWEHYKEDMFLIKIDNKEFGLKPMNCPSHLLMYKMKTKSYRDLPWRVADFAALHRNELKGVLGGLTRVRKFSQDDGHIFCTPEQAEKELVDLMDFIHFIYKDVFDMDVEINLSTRPEKAMGSIEIWNKSQAILEKALTSMKLPYNVKQGEGAFYGPKIDIDIRDALGRKWQCATVQMDMLMPKRFEATYEGQDGQKHTPIMIHRAIFGSLERFIGIITEHYAGKFPLWLSPVQVKVLTIADRHEIYADRVVETLMHESIRVQKDYRAETLNKKIREAQLEQVNYIVVVGDKESETETVSVRTRDNEVKGAITIEEFKKLLIKEIRFKKTTK